MEPSAACLRTAGYRAYSPPSNTASRPTRPGCLMVYLGDSAADVTCRKAVELLLRLLSGRRPWLPNMRLSASKTEDDGKYRLLVEAVLITRSRNSRPSATRITRVSEAPQPLLVRRLAQGRSSGAIETLRLGRLIAELRPTNHLEGM